MSLKCANCKTINPDGASFCGSCGAGFFKTCPTCRQNMPLDFAFCDNCGTPLTLPETPSSNNVKCQSCGFGNGVGAIFCDNCGSTLTAPLPPLPQPTWFNNVNNFNQVISQNTNQVFKILFLAANPKDTRPLRLDAEIRAIDQVLHQSQYRDRFEIKQHWAVSVMDIQSFLLRYQPNIVHFSGHGSPSNAIILDDSSGNSHPVSPRALSQLFSALKDNIRCVVLNACYSEQQAQAIAQNVDCVVGMSNQIGDASAIAFSMAFYQALGYGRDIRNAFELGCVQIDLENLGQHETPQLIALKYPPENIFFAR